MRDMTRAVLEAMGIGKVYVAQNGELGYQLLRKHNPDVLIVDWMMRPCNGIDFTHRVRSQKDSPNAFVPIIMMTGFNQKRRVLQARDAGVTEFMVKPFTARDLYKRIVQIIERPRQFVKAPQFFGPDRRRRKKDDPDAPKLYRRSDDTSSGRINKNQSNPATQ